MELSAVDLCSLITNSMVVFSGGPDFVTVEIRGEGRMPRRLCRPVPFRTEKGDRLIVPLREGIGYPVEEDVEVPESFGLSMPFFGVAEDGSGAGWMCLVETTDDMAVVPSRIDGRLTAGVEWLPQRVRFGYVRRLHFFSQAGGGHEAMAKRYRAIARSAGRLVTFAEKRNRRPQIDALVGAANVWYMYGSNAVDSVRLQAGRYACCRDGIQRND